LSDITELAEDLEDLYETAPCGFASLSPQGRIVKLNQTLSDWLGRPKEELLGRPFHEVLGFGGKIAFETHLAPLLRMQGYVYEVAVDLLHKDQGRIPTIVNAAEKRSAEGGHLFTRLTLFKAVDRRTYERTLLEARLKAEAGVKAERESALLREQFIAVLGHDLRNPVSAIASGIHMLKRREQLSDLGIRVVGEMEQSLARAERLISDLLDFARGRLGGGIPLDRREQRIEPMLEQVVAEIRMIAPDRRIESAIDVPLPVDCDGGRLAQLASNLLSNAVTHGGHGSPVQLDARLRDGQLILSIANQGDPIPEEIRERLFQPFFRNERRSSANGLGLGLFIASEIAKAHGGTLDVRSGEGEVIFTFVMPVRPPGAAESAP
jgi:phosphoserine phosphatase RsbU/P